jgi:hypothetical protein
MPATRKEKEKRHYFTVAEANATLPLVRVIVRDIAAVANTLRELHHRLARLQEAPDSAVAAELDETISQIERAQEEMRHHEQELEQLHIELKDHFTGLVDFRARVNGREVYLCWRQGEPEVAHWHELDAGFSGRKKLVKASNQ